MTGGDGTVDGFELGAQPDLRPLEAVVVDAFLIQRRRTVETARALSADEWSQPSRCSEWSAHELVVHVLGATQACRTTLTGERSVFAGGFDPNSGPNAFVDRRSGEVPATTLDDLEAEIARTGKAIETVQARTPAPQLTAVWGDEVDWRLFLTHMFWDGWMHERDLLLPLGREPNPSPAETRLAVAYGLHSAGIMIGVLGGTFDASLALGGVGRARYRVVANGGTDIRITVATLPADEPVAGDAAVVTDAIAGRGPELATVLDAPPEVVAALAQLGAFLNPEAPADGS